MYNLRQAGWTSEGLAWFGVQTGTPVYRLYNPNAGDHHYTTSSAEKNTLVQAGWTYEFIAFYVPASGSRPVYRFYNPNNTGAGAHFLIRSETEKESLISKGWTYEGVAWYVE